MVKTLEEIYQKAKDFVKEKFPDLRSNDERITILALMKNSIDLQFQEIEEQKLALEKIKAGIKQ